ncbi:MAG TPA: APC family permease [Gemmatimonadaceae bacterium]|nr:APC family permease [Gemmatimonadaceae bacterium]
MPLLRILGVWFGVAIVIGGTIGAGILRTPSLVMSHVGSPGLAIAVWIAAGLFAMAAAASLAELAAAIPKSGGFYVFAQRALGDRFGFVAGSADWFANSAAVAFVAVAAAEYLGVLWPALATHQTLVASAAIAVVASSQLVGQRASGRVQEAMSLIKTLAFATLVVAFFAADAPAVAAAPPRAGLQVQVVDLVSVALALQFAIGAYDGWQSGSYFAGEDVDPGRNLPRAFIGGTAIVMGVYVLLNLAVQHVLPADRIAASTLPIAEAASLVMGPRGATVVTLIAIWSPLTIMSATLLCLTRILYAMGSDGLLPTALGRVDKRGTPTIGLLCSTAAALALVQLGSFESVATVASVFMFTGYLSALVSLLVLRHREPGLPRPFRVWGAPWTVLVVIAGYLAIFAGIVAGAPRDAAIGIGVLVAGYAVYRVRTYVAAGL